VVHARRAVAEDLGDPESWYVLGNALLATFFAGTLDPADLSRALAAYAKSEANRKRLADDAPRPPPTSRTDADANADANAASAVRLLDADAAQPPNPDLCHNRGCVLAYLSRHTEAAVSFREALECDPAMEASRAELVRLRALERRVGDVLSTRAGMNAKTVRRFTAKLPAGGEELNGVPVATLAALRAAVDRGGDAGDQAAAAATATTAATAGKGQVLVVKVAATLSGRDEVPFAAAIVDAEGTFAAVSLYNLAANGAGSGDQLTIVDPALRTEQVALADGSTFTFASVACSDVRRVRVNGAPARAALTRLTMGSS
jgi:tetratricopeptide (TPR) repeat protein